MKSPVNYRFLIAAFALFLASQLHARPIGFSELSLMVRMHESEADIKDDVAGRKLLHQLTQPQESLLKSQGASDSLIQSLRDPKLAVSKEEAAAVEAAHAQEANPPAAEISSHREHHHRVLVFDVAFGHPINLSQWGGLDYEVAFYSYRFAGEDHIQPALIDTVGTRTVVSTLTPTGGTELSELVGSDWFPTNGVRNWRYTPYTAYDGFVDNRDGDFRDGRPIRFNTDDGNDLVAATSYSVSRPVVIDWNHPVYFDGQPYTFYPVYGAGDVNLYFINASTDSATVAIAFNR
jgi:hypothetical protein